jgi:hypothetical protein
MNLRASHKAIVLIFGLLLSSTVFAKVKSISAKGVNFLQYHTYQWYPPRILKKTGLVEDDDVVAPLIKKAVNNEMQQRGFTLVTDGADIQVSTWALREAVAQLEAFIYPAGGYQYGFGIPIGTMGRYNHAGTLVVNLIDAKTKKSAWAALETTTLEDLDQLESKINKATADIFKKYPVKPSK